MVDDALLELVVEVGLVGRAFEAELRVRVGAVGRVVAPLEAEGHEVLPGVRAVERAVVLEGSEEPARGRALVVCAHGDVHLDERHLLDDARRGRRLVGRRDVGLPQLRVGEAGNLRGRNVNEEELEDDGPDGEAVRLAAFGGVWVGVVGPDLPDCVARVVVEEADGVSLPAAVGLRGGELLHGDRRLLRQAVYPFAPLRAVVLPGYVEPVALVVVLDSEVNVRVSLEAVVAHPEHVVLPVPLEVCGEEGRQVCWQLRRVVLAEHEEGPAVDARGRDVVRVGVGERGLRGRGRGLRDGLRLCGDARLLPAPARV